jgi:hypothetical protein
MWVTLNLLSLFSRYVGPYINTFNKMAVCSFFFNLPRREREIKVQNCWIRGFKGARLGLIRYCPAGSLLHCGIGDTNLLVVFAPISVLWEVQRLELRNVPALEGRIITINSQYISIKISVHCVSFPLEHLPFHSRRYLC